jgi:hypothetical protein
VPALYSGVSWQESDSETAHYQNQQSMPYSLAVEVWRRNRKANRVYPTCPPLSTRGLSEQPDRLRLDKEEQRSQGKAVHLACKIAWARTAASKSSFVLAPKARAMARPPIFIWSLVSRVVMHIKLNR